LHSFDKSTKCFMQYFYTFSKCFHWITFCVWIFVNLNFVSFIFPRFNFAQDKQYAQNQTDFGRIFWAAIFSENVILPEGLNSHGTPPSCICFNHMCILLSTYICDNNKTFGSVSCSLPSTKDEADILMCAFTKCSHKIVYSYYCFMQ